MKMETIFSDNDQPNLSWTLDADKITYNDHFRLLRKLIEGESNIPCHLLEFVSISHDGEEKTLIVDENGVAMGRQINVKASELYPEGKIFGNAILVTGKKHSIMD
jgi:hypothetical protein